MVDHQRRTRHRTFALKVSSRNTKDIVQLYLTDTLRDNFY